MSSTPAVKNKRAPIEFSFQEIDIDDLDQILPPQYVDKYKVIKAQLVERLANLPAGKAFTFGSPKETLTEGMVNALEANLNKTLKQQGFLWRVVYSTDHKLFCVRPCKSRNERKPYKRREPLSSNETTPFYHKISIEKLFAETLHYFRVAKEDIGDKSTSSAVIARRAYVFVGRALLGYKSVHLATYINKTSGSMTCIFQAASANKEAIDKFVQHLKLNK